jgi:hypothetical protein
MALRDYIVHNFWLKLFSLVLATLTWFTIFAVQRNIHIGQLGMGASRTFTHHSITVLKLAADNAAYRVTPVDVDVTVTGRASILEKLSDREVEVFISLTDATNALVLNKKVQVFAPDGVSLVKVEPPVVHIERIRP